MLSFRHCLLCGSLGAKHDGEEGSGGDCSADDGYLMAPSSSPQSHREQRFFSFSPCSIRALYNTIKYVIMQFQPSVKPS